MKIQRDHVDGVIIENEAFENEMDAAPRKVRRKRKFNRKYLQPQPKRTRKRKPRTGLESTMESIL